MHEVLRNLSTQNRPWVKFRDQLSEALFPTKSRSYDFGFSNDASSSNKRFLFRSKPNSPLCEWIESTYVTGLKRPPHFHPCHCADRWVCEHLCLLYSSRLASVQLRWFHSCGHTANHTTESKIRHLANSLWNVFTVHDTIKGTKGFWFWANEPFSWATIVNFIG